VRNTYSRNKPILAHNVLKNKGVLWSSAQIFLCFYFFRYEGYYGLVEWLKWLTIVQSKDYMDDIKIKKRKMKRPDF
jgi:hypothetical protein